MRVTDERDQLSVSRAFHPLATLMSVTSQGGLNVMSQDVWWERVSRIPPGNLRRASRVALIDITGSAAVVRIDISSGETSSTDYLSLLKTRAGWRVVSKILSSPL
ncbi:MAG: nuclear transport factor 2 family protein [Sphingosinicella sp.]|nr:nuclear transport factor 2 family protein [Sphingosinicella sp.]